MRSISFLFSLFVLQATAQESGASEVGLTVQTQQGRVIGTFVDPTVRRFAGIPFATAKRWEVPQLPPHRQTDFHATEFGDSCIQDLNPANVEYLILSNTQGINVTSSEDCMSMNIWTPSVTRKQKTSVMIWIYGGGFTFGTSNVQMYDGTNLVRDNDDLIVVSFNYRLNIFGQPGAPQLGTNNVNFGLLDIEAAVNWVHNNIANFGGDPDRITLFGQSAGAAAADAFVFAHPQDKIVKGIITESGTVTGFGGLINPANVHTGWDTVAVAVGCGNTTNAEQFACMQRTSAKTLENAVISTNAGFNLVTDDRTIFADTLTRAASGNFSHVPMLSGTTLNEDDIFMVAGELVSTGFAVPTLTQIISDLETLTSMTCPAGQAAIFRINANVPNFRYQYQAVFPGVSTRQDLRAFHSSEIQMVFGTFRISSPNPSSTQIALSRYIQRAWVSFARNPPQGLIDFGWPLYDPNTASLAQIGGITNQSGVAFTQGNLTDLACKNATQTTLNQVLLQLFELLSA